MFATAIWRVWRQAPTENADWSSWVAGRVGVSPNRPPAATVLPASPKAPRAFLTTATSSLVSNRAIISHPELGAGETVKPDSENGCVLSVSYADSMKIQIDDSGSDHGS